MKEQDFGSGMGSAIKYIIAAGLIGFLLNQALFADEMVHKFKSPSFNGMGISAHYLTIENQETNRKNEAKEAIQAALEEAERDLENTTLARFMKNLESRIYSQLSRDLVDNLFADGIGTEASGVIELEGNIIEYSSDGITVTLKVTDSEGNVTEISIPIGSFGDFSLGSDG
tara:strand:+ start:66 stop:578 length:513 start_codon:yes stop_codon:yes gene_type:complete